MGERERVSGGLQGPAWERSESGRVGTAIGANSDASLAGPPVGQAGLQLGGTPSAGEGGGDL